VCVFFGSPFENLTKKSNNFANVADKSPKYFLITCLLRVITRIDYYHVLPTIIYKKINILTVCNN